MFLPRKSQSRAEEASNPETPMGETKKPSKSLRSLAKGPCEDGAVLYLDYTDINELAVILYFSFARGIHWGKVSKGYPASV